MPKESSRKNDEDQKAALSKKESHNSLEQEIDQQILSKMVHDKLNSAQNSAAKKNEQFERKDSKVLR